jgi:uncharacterized DUF497 family protein
VYFCAYNRAVVKLQWDAVKARSNLRKHGVDFADAAEVLADDAAITVPDTAPDEQRWITLGADPACEVLVVVYTWRGETIRLISARRATPRERRQYEEARR